MFIEILFQTDEEFTDVSVCGQGSGLTYGMLVNVSTQYMVYHLENWNTD